MFEVGDVVRINGDVDVSNFLIGSEPRVFAQVEDVGIVVPNDPESDDEYSYTVRWMRSGQTTWHWYANELEKVDDTDI